MTFFGKSAPAILGLCVLSFPLFSACDNSASGTYERPETDGGKKDPQAADKTDKKDAPTKKGAGKHAPQPKNGGKAAKNGKSGPVEPKDGVPAIHLSEQHRKSCLVKQNDSMPELELTDLEGNPQNLQGLMGEKATVVCFWKGDSRLAKWQLSDMEPDVAKAYAEDGLNVVAINVGEPAEEVKDTVEQAKLSYPVLLDADGQAFAQVATDFLPRTYLLDADGKIIWFDLGYTSETLRHLHKAIRNTLKR